MLRDRGSKKSLINKCSWLKKTMKLLDWSVSVSFVVISSIPNQTSLAGKMFNSKLIPQSAFWQTLTNRNLLASIGWRNKILTYVFGVFLFDLITTLSCFRSAECSIVSTLKRLKCTLLFPSIKTYLIRFTYFISIVLAAGGYEWIILFLNYNQYKKTVCSITNYSYS